MEDLVLSIPAQDKALIETLAQRMGWTMRNRRTSVERFIDSCPKSPQMTDDEIQAEVNEVRYGTTSSVATVTSPTSKNMQAFQS